MSPVPSGVVEGGERGEAVAEVEAARTGPPTKGPRPGMEPEKIGGGNPVEVDPKERGEPGE